MIINPGEGNALASKLGTTYHNLSVMLAAGMPILKALQTVCAGLRGNLKITFSKLADSATAGVGISDKMAENPTVFDQLDMMVVKAGEQAGKLPESFMLLSRWHDFKKHLNGIIRSGMLLPGVILHIGAVIAPVAQLLLGRLTIAGYILEVLLVLGIFYIPAIVIIAIVRFTPEIGSARKYLDQFTLMIPVLGKAVKYLSISRYCRAFNMLYKAGLPIADCAKQALQIAGNVIVAGWFEGGYDSIKAGEAMFRGFSAEIPLDLRHIWEVGEETGQLDDCIERVADNTSDTAELLLREFCKWLPRLIYFLICIMLIIQIFRGFSAIYSTYPG